MHPTPCSVKKADSCPVRVPLAVSVSAAVSAAEAVSWYLIVHGWVVPALAALSERARLQERPHVRGVWWRERRFGGWRMLLSGSFGSRGASGL
jgi:hypothetical protein